MANRPSRKRGVAMNPPDPAQAVPRWSKDLPNDQCLWWWWNEDEDSTPFPVSIFYSGTSDSYFAPEGQWGWTRYQPVEEMGGWWMRIIEPALPSQGPIHPAPEPAPVAGAHTPGPWSYTLSRSTSDDEHDVYEIHGNESKLPLHTWVASARTCQVEPEIAEANARLIAASPDLLAALEKFVGTCDRGNPQDFIRNIGIACEQARAAVAKAKGAK